MRLFRKARFFWVYLLVIVLFATASTSEPSLRLGIALALLGEAVRLWANGYVGHAKVNATQRTRNDPKIGRLITAGPYAYVRNPLYLGSFLIGAGFCVAVRSSLLLFVGAVLCPFVYRKKVAQEERVIRDEWGEEYAAYQQAVPRWLPTWRRYARRSGQWSWQGIAASRELKTLLWVIVSLLAVYFWEEWFKEHEFFVRHDLVKQVTLVVVLVLLVVGDGVFEWVRGRRAAKKQMTL